MAEEIATNRLAELSHRAAASRQALTLAGENLRAASNLSRRVSTSIRGNTTVWMGSAALLGWVLSRLPARKKTVYRSVGNGKNGSAAESKLLKSEKSGLKVAIFGFIFQAIRPILQKYLVEYVREQAKARFVKHSNSDQRGRSTSAV